MLHKLGEGWKRTQKVRKGEEGIKERKKLGSKGKNTVRTGENKDGRKYSSYIKAQMKGINICDDNSKVTENKGI